jgi:hypothetical protein
MEVIMVTGLKFVDSNKNGVVDAGDIVLDCGGSGKMTVSGHEFDRCEAFVIGTDNDALNGLLAVKESEGLAGANILAEKFEGFLTARTAYSKAMKGPASIEDIRRSYNDIRVAIKGTGIYLDVNILRDEAENAVSLDFADELEEARVYAEAGDVSSLLDIAIEAQRLRGAFVLIFLSWDAKPVREPDIITEIKKLKHDCYCKVVNDEEKRPEPDNYRISYYEVHARDATGFDCNGNETGRPTDRELDSSRVLRLKKNYLESIKDLSRDEVFK